MVEADDGLLYVLKLRDVEEPYVPAAELLGVLCARLLDVKTPAGLVLRVEPQLPAVLRVVGDEAQAQLADALEYQGGVAFGSRLQSTFEPWSPALMRSRRLSVDALLRVWVLDFLVQNGDRHHVGSQGWGGNPNLMIVERELVAYDHEQGFPPLHFDDPELYAAELRQLSAMVQPPSPHLCDAFLEANRLLLGEHARRVRELSDGGLRAAVDAVPQVWWAQTCGPDAIYAWLRQRRELVSQKLDSMVFSGI